MPLPADLQQALDEYLDSLPWYRRWPLKAALAVDGWLDRRADAGTSCLVIFVIVFLLFLLILGIIIKNW